MKCNICFQISWEKTAQLSIVFSTYFYIISGVHGYLDSCEVQKSLSGEISSNASYYLNYTACWKINVPENNSVTINVTKLNFRGMVNITLFINCHLSVPNLHLIYTFKYLKL